MSVAADFDRLEIVVEELARRHTLLRAENEALRGRLARRDERVARLEAELAESRAQSEQAAGRLDELIGEIDQLESGLASLALANAMKEDGESATGKEATEGRGARRSSGSAPPPSGG